MKYSRVGQLAIIFSAQKLYILPLEGVYGIEKIFHECPGKKFCFFLSMYWKLLQNWAKMGVFFIFVLRIAAKNICYSTFTASVDAFMVTGTLKTCKIGHL